jgi:sec-independent protein translocase protein TatC
VFTPRLQDVFGTYVRLLAGMALAFQMPPVVYLLARMRLVTARWLARRTKYAVLVIAIAAAVLTPSTDPFNQALYAAPMLGLYLLSIAVAWLAYR